MQGLVLRGKSAAHFLDGPRFFAARGLPEQLSGFLGAALGDERLVEGFFEACAAPRLAAARRAAEAPLPFPAASLTRKALDTALIAAAIAAGVRVKRGRGVRSEERRVGKECRS